MFGLVAVQKYRSNHTRSSQAELQGQGEVKDEDTGHTGDDDGEAAGEPLEDVVCVLDDHRHEESASGVEGDEVNDKQVVAVEKTFSHQSILIWRHICTEINFF